MGRASRLKKERNAINNGNTPKKISDTLLNKIERQVRRDMGHGKGLNGAIYQIPVLKEYKCQVTGQKVYLPAEIVPYEKEDGKLYFRNLRDEEELLVSDAYQMQQAQREYMKELKTQWSKDKNISQLKPETLGMDE